MAMATFGEIVTWNIRSAFVARQEFQDVLDHHGIKMKLPKRGKGEYLKRALTQATNDGLVRKVGESAERVSYAVIHEDTSLRDEEWRGTAHAIATVEKKTGELRIKGASALLMQIRAGIEKGEGGLISPEIGGVLKRILSDKLDAVSLRDTGGVYFIPARSTEMLDALEQSIQEILNAGATLRIQRLGVIAGTREAKDIAEVYLEAVEREVSELKQGATTLMKEIATCKPSTFVKRAQRLREIEKQVRTYERTLGISAEETRTNISRTVAYIKKVGELCAKKRAAERNK